MNKTIEFDKENQVRLTNEEVLSFIDEQKKVTILFSEGFESDSDTEDVFRGLMGNIAFEEDPKMIDALDGVPGVTYTFFICNDKEETPFNERGMTKRLIQDNFWTGIVLHDHPLKNGYYAKVINHK